MDDMLLRAGQQMSTITIGQAFLGLALLASAVTVAHLRAKRGSPTPAHAAHLVALGLTHENGSGQTKDGVAWSGLQGQKLNIGYSRPVDAQYGELVDFTVNVVGYQQPLHIIYREHQLFYFARDGRAVIKPDWDICLSTHDYKHVRDIYVAVERAFGRTVPAQVQPRVAA